MLRARRKVLSIVLYPSLRAPIAIGISKVKDEEEVVQTKFTHSPTASEHHHRYHHHHHPSQVIGDSHTLSSAWRVMNLKVKGAQR